MDCIIPVSEFRERLFELIKKVSKMNNRLIITRNGRSEAVILSPEELETLEVKADKKLLQSILRAEEDIKEGNVYSHRDVFSFEFCF